VHSHNAYLQTWHEAGAVGALFLLGIGLLVLRALAQCPERDQPYLFAAFTTCAVIAASGFSLWQAWFMASLGFAAIFAALGRALTEPGGERV
jgi:O-antigen ligase